MLSTLNNGGEIIFRLKENKYATRAEYEASQNKLPDSARDGIITHYIVRKIIWLTHEKSDTGELVLTRNIEHDIPKIMFALLPLFALFIGFFYSHKKYVYSQHAIFSLHFHSFVFIFLLLTSLVERILPMEKIWQVMTGITLSGIFIYLSLALYNVYRQPLWLSFIKALCLSVLYIITLLLCVGIVIVVSFILLK